MKSVTAGGATFTQITLEEMRKFLRGAFHALEPQREENSKGEVIINLPLSDRVFIKVFTSISTVRAEAAGVGSDAIRVGLYRDGRPLKSGSWPIVKRTQGWKDNLRERIEDMMEKYDTLSQDIEAGKFIQWA